jgi:hypothetical protein
MTLTEAIERFPPVWLIYDHPADHPGCFVVRVWYGAIRGPEIGCAPTENLARQIVLGQGASYCLGRDKKDDPVIVEAWV